MKVKNGILRTKGSYFGMKTFVFCEWPELFELFSNVHAKEIEPLFKDNVPQYTITYRTQHWVIYKTETNNYADNYVD